MVGRKTKQRTKTISDKIQKLFSNRLIILVTLKKPTWHFKYLLKEKERSFCQQKAKSKFRYREKV